VFSVFLLFAVIAFLADEPGWAVFFLILSFALG
jgi:hypothetical protein